MKCKKCGLPIHVSKPGVEAGFCSVECAARYRELHGPPEAESVPVVEEVLDEPVKKPKKKRVPEEIKPAPFELYGVDKEDEL